MREQCKLRADNYCDVWAPYPVDFLRFIDFAFNCGGGCGAAAFLDHSTEISFGNFLGNFQVRKRDTSVIDQTAAAAATPQ